MTEWRYIRLENIRMLAVKMDAGRRSLEGEKLDHEACRVEI
jgi:hypothetical protein